MSDIRVSKVPECGSLYYKVPGEPDELVVYGGRYDISDETAGKFEY